MVVEHVAPSHMLTTLGLLASAVPKGSTSEAAPMMPVSPPAMLKTTIGRTSGNKKQHSLGFFQNLFLPLCHHKTINR